MERKRWIDIAKCIGIICVIIGHTISSTWINSFHMPLFFILTGYTFKKIGNKSWGETFLEKTKLDAKRIVIPLLVTIGLDILTHYYMTILPYLHGSEFSGLSVIELNAIKKMLLKEKITNRLVGLVFGLGDYCPEGIYNYQLGAMWFLVVLFYSKLFYRLLQHFINNDYFRLVVTFVLCIIGVLVGSHYHVIQGLDIVLVVSFLFECGYLLKNIECKLRKGNVLYIVMGVMAIIWFFCQLFMQYSFDIHTRKYPMGVLSVLLGVFGSCFVILVSKVLEKVKYTKILEFIGKNSVYLLCIHYLDTNLVFTNIYQSETLIYMIIKRIILDVIVLYLFINIRDVVKKQFVKIKDV